MDHKLQDHLGQDIVKALARHADELSGITGARIHADITRQTGYTHQLSALGKRIEELCLDGVVKSTMSDGVAYYALVANPREVIPPLSSLDRDVAKYCATS